MLLRIVSKTKGKIADLALEEISVVNGFLWQMRRTELVGLLRQLLVVICLHGYLSITSGDFQSELRDKVARHSPTQLLHHFLRLFDRNAEVRCAFG